MTVPSLFMAIRAIGTEFGQRIYIPVVSIIAGVLVAVIGVLIWLVTLSGWWWFLLAPIIILTLIFIFTAVIAGVILKLLKPTQTKHQRQLVRQFVDTIQNASETIQTPRFVILFRLVKDVVRPSEQSYIRQLSTSAVSLKAGLQEIIDSFN